MVAFVTKEICQSEKHYPRILDSLLEEFQDLSLQELCNELSPMKNIQHQIDLVLGIRLLIFFIT